MEYNQLITNIICKKIADYLDNKHLIPDKNYSRFFDSPEFAYLRNNENAKKINEYVLGLTVDVTQRVYSLNRDYILHVIHDGIKPLISDLFSEEQAKDLYNNITSDNALRLIRNLDLIQESISKGVDILTLSIIKEWSDPTMTEKITEKIIEFVNKLEEEEEGGTLDG